MRRQHGGETGGCGEYALPGVLADPSQPLVGPGRMLGMRGGAVAANVQRHLAAVQPWHWIVVSAPR